jgi:hypothetical protein
MPAYTFVLHDDDSGAVDDTGVNLPNEAAAYRYTCDVVRELMHFREQRTRDWQLDVYETDGAKVFAIPFATLDPTLEHLRPELRDVVEQVCQRRRSLKDTLSAATRIMQEAKSLLARSHGRPYLAADQGRRVIREDA